MTQKPEQLPDIIPGTKIHPESTRHMESVLSEWMNYFRLLLWRPVLTDALPPDKAIRLHHSDEEIIGVSAHSPKNRTGNFATTVETLERRHDY